MEHQDKQIGTFPRITTGRDQGAERAKIDAKIEIPAYFRPISQAMQRSGIKASRIHNTLVIKAQFSGHAISWTLNDVRHTFGITTQDRILDSSILDDWLKTHTSTCGLEGAILERAGRLSSCYFEMDRARELYQAIGDNTCVIFDTTFNKNSFGMRYLSSVH